MRVLTGKRALYLHARHNKIRSEARCSNRDNTRNCGGDGMVRWPNTVAIDSNVRIAVKPFAMLPLTTAGQVPRLNALAYKEAASLFIPPPTTTRLHDL